MYLLNGDCGCFSSGLCVSRSSHGKRDLTYVGDFSALNEFMKAFGWLLSPLYLTVCGRFGMQSLAAISVTVRGTIQSGPSRVFTSYIFSFFLSI